MKRKVWRNTDQERGEASTNEGSAWTPEAMKILQNYSVFATSFAEEIGLAPKSAKVDDYICSFEGSNVWGLCEQTAPDKPLRLRLPRERETFGMISKKPKHYFMSIVPGRENAHRRDQHSFVWIDVASLQSLTRPDRPAAG